MFIFLFLCLPFAYASIVLKIMGVNPSTEQEQVVMLKAYLPKEVKPEDVLDRGDLELIYDTQQGSYYVYGEFSVPPRETIEREVELEDIWHISNTELESIRGEAIQTAKLLENTDFEERAVFLKQSIETKLNEINKRQSVPALNSQKHISNFRDNERLLDIVKEELMLARSLLAKAKSLSPVSIWRIIIVVLGLLTALGLALYIIWHRQVSVITSSATFSDRMAEPSSAKKETSGPQIHKPQEEKNIKGEDVEKIMREE